MCRGMQIRGRQKVNFNLLSLRNKSSKVRVFAAFAATRINFDERKSRAKNKNALIAANKAKPKPQQFAAACFAEQVKQAGNAQLKQEKSAK